MAYTTTQDVIDRLGNALAAQLTTESSSTTPDQDVITEHRAGAEALVDSYLAKRYQVPIDTAVYTHVAELLKSKALDVCVYELRKRRPPVPDDVTKAYESVVAWLTAVAAGDVDLPAVAAALPAPTTSGPVAVVDGSARVFSRDKTEGL